ncbi:MAG: hypothetical protein EOO77_46455, partial [Oxalobacteraceae bacterium]
MASHGTYEIKNTTATAMAAGMGAAWRERHEIGPPLEAKKRTDRQRPIAVIPHVDHKALMTVARDFLLEALQRIADGGDVTESELNIAVLDPFALDPAEKIAWEELSHWADDDDIRERDEP